MVRAQILVSSRSSFRTRLTVSQNNRLNPVYDGPFCNTRSGKYARRTLAVDMHIEPRPQAIEPNLHVDTIVRLIVLGRTYIDDITQVS
jgi:hypothetical protein